MAWYISYITINKNTHFGKITGSGAVDIILQIEFKKYKFAYIILFTNILVINNLDHHSKNYITQLFSQKMNTCQMKHMNRRKRSSFGYFLAIQKKMVYINKHVLN